MTSLSLSEINDPFDLIYVQIRYSSSLNFLPESVSSLNCVKSSAGILQPKSSNSSPDTDASTSNEIPDYAL